MATKTVRAPMPRSRRAKQFMPFDALTGLREAIAAKERVTEPRRYLQKKQLRKLTKLYVGFVKDKSLQLFIMEYMNNYIFSLRDQLQKWIRTGTIFKLETLR